MARKQVLLPATWNVPEIFRRRLGNTVGRQRLMQADGHLLLVLHKPPAPDDAERSGRTFWRQPDGTWSSNDLGAGHVALNKHLAQYGELLETADNKQDEATTAEEYFDVLEAVGPLHRAIRNCHQVLQEARTACPDDREVINYRDRAYDLERRGELLANDAKNGLDFAIARRGEEQARSSHEMSVAAHRLNLLAAFFFPMATLAAILGMNVKHGMEEWTAPWTFMAVLGGGFLLGLVLQAFLRRPAS